MFVRSGVASLTWAMGRVVGTAEKRKDGIFSLDSLWRAWTTCAHWHGYACTHTWKSNGKTSMGSYGSRRFVVCVSLQHPSESSIASPASVVKTLPLPTISRFSCTIYFSDSVLLGCIVDQLLEIVKLRTNATAKMRAHVMISHISPLSRATQGGRASVDR